MSNLQYTRWGVHSISALPFIGLMFIRDAGVLSSLRNPRCCRSAQFPEGSGRPLCDSLNGEIMSNTKNWSNVVQQLIVASFDALSDANTQDQHTTRHLQLPTDAIPTCRSYRSP